MNKEIQKIRQDADSYAVKKQKLLLQAYKRALDDVRMEISKIYMNYTVDGELKVGKQQRYTVLKNLEKKLSAYGVELGKSEKKLTSEILTDVYEDSYYKTAYIIDKGVEVTLDFSILKPEFVKAAIEMPIEGKMFSERIWDNKEKLVNRVRRDVERAMIQGKSVEKLARDIKNDFGSSAYESKRLLSNEVARCVGQAQDEIYKESGLVKEVLLDATLDDKTSEICQLLDGKRFPLDNHPNIPEDTHVGCRSCIIPIVNGWNPSRKRENIKNSSGNKQIIEYKDYNSWKKSRNID